MPAMISTNLTREQTVDAVEALAIAIKDRGEMSIEAARIYATRAYKAIAQCKVPHINLKDY